MKTFIPFVLAAALLAGCDGEGGDIDIRLDSAGSSIERAGRKVTQELDTAFRDIKTGVNEAQVEGALHALRGMEGVDVDLADSVAVLRGTVPTQADKTFAEEIFRRMKGVATVTNELTVGPVPGGAGPDTAK